jgi:teichoic acid transport system permease protein
VTVGGPDQQGSLPGLSSTEAAALAQRHGMEQVGVRPPLGTYLRQLWRHRSFLLTMSSADFVARHQQNYLGQVWSILNPLLLGAAYFAIFGLLLDIRAGVDNYVAYLLIGLFSFIFVSAGMNHGSRALTGNMSLVRALRFPRVVLPLSVTATELFATLPAYGVVLVIAIGLGETPTWAWLLYPVGILITFLVTCGLAMLFARLVYAVRDAGNLVPLLTRMLRYVSGVFFVIPAYADNAVVNAVLSYQPVAVCLTMLRQCLMEEFPPTLTVWLVSAGWAVLLFVAGLVVFWRGEATYGRH